SEPGSTSMLFNRSPSCVRLSVLCERRKGKRALVSRSFLCKHSNKILFDQVDRNSKQNHIFHQKSNIPDHCRKSSGRLGPAVRHKGNDRDSAQKGHDRSESPQNSQLLVPESSQQQCSDQPLRNAKEVGCAFHPEHRVHPEDERSMRKEWDQFLRLVIKPLLIPEEEVNDHH